MASDLNFITRKMTGAGPAGTVVSFPNRIQALKISARSEAWLRIPLYGEQEERLSAPTAPVASPAPAANAVGALGWIHMKSGEVRVLPMAKGQTYYQDILLWEIGTDEIDFDGTDPGYGR